MRRRTIVCRRNVAIAAWTLALALSALASACGRGPAWTDGVSTLRTVVDVERPDPMAAPGPTDAMIGTVVLDVSAVELEHHYGGWSPLQPEIGRVDLFDDDALPTAIASGEVPDGTYDRLRLRIDGGEVEIDGTSQPLHVGDGAIEGPFCVGRSGFPSEDVVLVWDLAVGLRHDAALGYVLDTTVEPLDTRACFGDAT